MHTTLTSCSRARTRVALSLLVSLPATSLCAQSCPLPPQPDHQFRHAWGGDIRAVHTALVNGNRRIITGSDGGRIARTADDGVTWSYAQTPLDFPHTLLDIEFLDDARGFACGRGGQILKTADGGLTWTKFGTALLDPCGHPATLWAVHPFTDSVVLVAGLHVFSYTINAGTTWAPLGLFEEGSNYGGTPLSAADFEFYDLSIAGTLGNFRGIASAEWDHPTTGDRGVVFHTDAPNPASAAGRKWIITLDDTTYTGPTLPGGDVMLEPWSLAFERGAQPTTAIGYVFGGVGANSPGRGYRTADGGLTWTMDWAGGPTPYRVTAEPNNRVMVAAYSGTYLTRNGPGNWTQRTLPGPAGGVLTPGLSTAALGGIDSSDGDHFVVGGGFGLCQKTADFGNTFTESNPLYSLDVEEQRLGDIAVDRTDPLVAYACGQVGGILKTKDGGCTWAHQNHDTTIVSLQGIAFRDANNGIAVGTNGTLLYTLNAGAQWLQGQIVLGSGAGVDLLDVAMQGTDEAWAVGHQAGSARVFYTNSRGQFWVELPPPFQPDLRLTGVVWPSQNRGIVVGWSQAGTGDSYARAYVGDFDPMTGALAWTEVSPPHPVINPNTGNPNGQSLPLRQKLLSIDCSDGSMSTAAIYTCGNGGMVLTWDNNANAFVDVPAVYDTDSLGNVLSRMLDTDLSAVGVSPSGQHVLIGGQYDIGTFKSGLGYCLRFNGAWSKIRALNGKNTVGIGLSADGVGWVAGQTSTNSFGDTADGERLDGCQGYATNDQASASFDLGNLADSIILRYIAQ